MCNLVLHYGLIILCDHETWGCKNKSFLLETLLFKYAVHHQNKESQPAEQAYSFQKMSPPKTNMFKLIITVTQTNTANKQNV